MKVLVTGGAGYIGSHLVDRLIDRGDEVWVIDDLSTGRIDNIAHHMGESRFHFVNGSILDEERVERMVRKVDLVYHLAAVVGVTNVLRNPLDVLAVNVRGTESVFRAAFTHWKRVCLASTSEIYGKTGKLPFHEDDDRVLGPTHVHRWCYSTSKALDEHLAFAYASQGLPVSIVRYFNSYGPRIVQQGYGSVVAKFIDQAFSGNPLTVYGDGSQTRCFTYVSDTVEGTLRAGEMPAAAGKAFNVGSSAEITVLELARRIVAASSSSSEIRLVPYEAAYGPGFEDTRRRVPDTSRAKTVLEWSCAVRLDEGLERTIAWCRENYRRA